MTALHLSLPDIATLAFEDIVNPSLVYALALPALIRLARSREPFCAAAAGLAAGLLAAGLLPDTVERLWIVAGAAAVLAVVCLTQWRKLRAHRAEREEVEVVLTLLAFGSFLLCLVFLGFALATGTGGGGGVRPLAATIILVVSYRPLALRFARGHGHRIAWGIAAAGFIVLCGRGLVWGWEFRSVDSIPPRNGSVFANINRLHSVQEGLLQLEEGRLGDAVVHFRRTLRGSDPERIPLRVSRWSGLPRESLAMILAFGGRGTVGRRSSAVSFSWDAGSQRLLVLDGDGRLVVLDTTHAPLDLGIVLPEAVAVSASRDGSRIGLLSADGQVSVADKDGREVWKRSLPEATYRDFAAAETPDRFLALREDGTVFRVTPQEAERLTGYPTWPGTNPAISIATTPRADGHYVLDRFGGVHPRGETAIRYDDLRAHAQTGHYWPGQDTARSIQISQPGGYPVFVDRYGGLHTVVKRSGQVTYRGNDYPPLDRPIAVDLLTGILPRMIFILCRDGSILPTPERGWLLPPEEG